MFRFLHTAGLQNLSERMQFDYGCQLSCFDGMNILDRIYRVNRIYLFDRIYRVNRMEVMGLICSNQYYDQFFVVNLSPKALTSASIQFLQLHPVYPVNPVID